MIYLQIITRTGEQKNNQQIINHKHIFFLSDEHIT